MRNFIGGIFLVAGIVLIFTAFLFTLGLPLAILGAAIIFWPRKAKPK